MCTFVSGESLEANSLLLKLSTHQGELFNRSVTFSSDSGGTFAARIQGFEQGVSLRDTPFILDQGQSKPLSLFFDTSLLKPGVYVGSLVLSGTSVSASVPLILEVESEDVFFDANVDIPPQYSEVKPGEKVVAQIKVFDLTAGGGTRAGLGPTNVLLHYAIVDSMGKQVSSESETVSVDTTTQITQALGFPDSMPPGDYVFYVSVAYKSSVGTSSHLFKISDSPGIFTTLLGESNQTHLIIGVFVLFFCGMLGFFMYLLRDRDSLILELHRLNAKDYHRQRSFVQAQARVLVHKTGKSLSAVVHHELSKLKAHHQARVVHLKALCTKGDVGAMKKQLAQWKREYTSGKGLPRLHGLSSHEMSTTLARWKKEYKH
jgi:hypothetical protein